MALPLLIPWNVVGTIWQVFGRSDIGLLGYYANWLGLDYNYVNDPFDARVTIIIMDVWHWTSLVVLLCYASLVSIRMPIIRQPESTEPRGCQCSVTSSCRR